MRVLLNLPEPPDSNLILNDETKNRMMEEQVKKMNKLEIFMVGENVDFLKKGDIVYIPNDSLQRASVVEVDDKPKAMVNSMDIAIIW